MKFPRTLRLDQSDTRVFAHAAEPGEWAVPGGFAFADCDPETLGPKERLAFAQGWLGTENFGFASLVEVAEIAPDEFERVIDRLAQHFVERYGAPDLAAARPVAATEAKGAAELCDHKIHTLLALERGPGANGVIERFRVIQPQRAGEHARIWTIVNEGEV
ncbi:MAG: hypothetical protein EXQ92_10680 [Alphaproteobacteria bacterium]|nr:hypothetical protein [Alphaproteobacteria bacterium]